jgi:hypothetical protein
VNALQALFPRAMFIISIQISALIAEHALTHAQWAQFILPISNNQFLQ